MCDIIFIIPCVVDKKELPQYSLNRFALAHREMGYSMRTKAPSQVGGVKIFVLWVFISVIVGSIAFAVERTKYAPGVTVKIGTYATLSGTAELNGT